MSFESLVSNLKKALKTTMIDKTQTKFKSLEARERSSRLKIARVALIQTELPFEMRGQRMSITDANNTNFVF